MKNDALVHHRGFKVLHFPDFQRIVAPDNQIVGQIPNQKTRHIDPMLDRS